MVNSSSSPLLRGEVHFGRSFCMAITERIPTAKQKSPQTVVVKILRWTPVLSVYIPEIIRFVGVPIKVQMPPIPEA